MELCRGSRYLRSVLSTFIKELDEITDGDASAEAILDSAIDVEHIWHMCEIFLLSPPTKLMSLEVAKWLKSCGKQVFMEHVGRDILSMAQPELYEGTSGGGISYWAAVHALAMQGDLNDCWELLSLHSKIAGASGMSLVSSVSTRSSSSSSSTRRTGLEAQAVEKLQNLLTSHPYAPLSADSTDYNDDSLASNSNLSAELQAWKGRVEAFRTSQAGAALLGRIPELSVLVGVLDGDEEALSSAAGPGNWEAVAVARLLFVYAPPLSRPNLCKILESAIALKAEAPSDGDGNNVRGWLRSIMRGQVGPALRAMYEHCSSVSLGESMVQIPLLVSNVFLCFLLINGAGVADLMQPNPIDMGSDLSYYEQLLQDACIELQARHVTLDTLLCFIDACPTTAMQMTLQLLPSIHATSDEEALQITDELRVTANNANGREAAADVEALREELYVAAQQLDSQRGQWWEHRRAEKRESIERCFLFFARAEEYSRVAALIEGTLQRCISAVCACQCIFSGIHPAKLNIKVHKVHIHKHTDPEAERSNLLTALNEAHEVLVAAQALPQSGLTIAERNSRALLHCLQGYTQGIRAYAEFADARSDIVSLKEAAEITAALVVKQVAPIRYWVHIVELATWLGNKYRDAENALGAGSTAPKAVFRKPVAYGLIQSLERALASPDKSRLDNGATDATLRELRLNSLRLLTDSFVLENSLISVNNGTALQNGRKQSQKRNVMHEEDPPSGLDLLSGHSLYY